MEPVQYGESSKSPARRSNSPGLNGLNTARAPNGETRNGSASHMEERTVPPITKSRLVLPVWDVPHPKPLHPSHDLISLLSLAPLYNTYVRPYASGVEDDNNQAGGIGDVDEDGDEKMGMGNGGVGKGRNGATIKGRKLERGYINLLDDCIDPIPNGTHAAPSLVPLIQDLTFQPTGPPPEIWEGPIEILPVEKWNVARLEVGSQSGYKGGEKDGVRKAEEKRRRKRENRIKALQPIIPAPSETSGLGSNPLTPGPYSTPGTPLLPVAPPSRAGPPGFSSRPSANHTRPPPINPAHSTPGQSSGTAKSGTFRPTGAPSRPQTPAGSTQLAGGVKRVYEGQGAGMSKKAKIAGTRSASPMPSSSLGKTGDGKSGQPQGKTQVRPGFGKGGRAKTEGM